jgi:hypothetical protein
MILGRRGTELERGFWRMERNVERTAMPKNRFHKGDRVKFRFGTRTLRGTVTEDRGPIGIGGRRLYEVEFRHEAASESTSRIELPADELQPMHAAVRVK